MERGQLIPKNLTYRTILFHCCSFLDLSFRLFLRPILFLVSPRLLEEEEEEDEVDTPWLVESLFSPEYEGGGDDAPCGKQQVVLRPIEGSIVLL
mmetsp:Transcript_15699/g.28560  ORF Transcript_15699/g.28560 Transcript_15699/m.28560 type:complete len:94 (-) Transcript_15699:2684-2965(-)